MNTKNHYDQHLSHFYSWMVGDFGQKAAEQQTFFEKNGIIPESFGLAIDLGAGHGLQAIPLARLGFSVTAIDFSATLLKELEERKGRLDITTIEADITDTHWHGSLKPELVICMGDTISHLESFEQLESLTLTMANLLTREGKLIYSFRDYSLALEDTQRFIPVKSDSNRIHTCLLEYFDDTVRVTDLLHEKQGEVWQQKVSSYTKLRLTSEIVSAMIEKCGLNVISEGVHNRMSYLIAQK
ncbi:MAG: methyltransferase domain-containing protein [Imperialibacter sp.]|uniref:class I SAM-dependent methyltransferase n=1 Tax=Imperialibacter sp. TaxID=2038411 RepID=UPI0032EC10F5